METIISGGQTGADRAALDFAIARRIEHGGWCPRGRLAEDGTISERYQLAETPNFDWAQRTEWNVRDSHGTVIISIAPELAGGSKRPALVVADLSGDDLILCQITSQTRSDGYSIPLTAADFERGRLAASRSAGSWRVPAAGSGAGAVSSAPFQTFTALE